MKNIRDGLLIMFRFMLPLVLCGLGCWVLTLINEKLATCVLSFIVVMSIGWSVNN